MAMVINHTPLQDKQGKEGKEESNLKGKILSKFP
jgi:hypothetical protein